MSATTSGTSNSASGRVSTGIPELDGLLGGGLLPGTLTVVAGATGIGKTQLGVTFARAGVEQEGAPGIFFDMTTRGDSQNHADYAERLFQWPLSRQQTAEHVEPTQVWEPAHSRRDLLHIFQRNGRRVSRGDLDEDDWRAWKIELSRKIQFAIWFFYGNFIHGVRRCVIDGIEPIDKPSDSFQFDMFEYIYHQILHKDADWVARDLFREHFLANSEAVSRHMYDHRKIACVLLYTTHEVLLEDMLQRRLDTGDVLANANTIILMGKTRQGDKMGRALHIAKHRGSACEDAIVPFEIHNDGLRLFR